MAEYYNRKGYISVLSDTTGNQLIWRDECNKFIDIAYDKGYLSDDGTTRTKIPALVEAYYDEYNKSVDGNRDTLWLTSKIETSIDNGRPVIGDLVSPSGNVHSVVICGYYDITVKYKTSASSSTKSKTYRYYIINDGYKEGYADKNERIQYVRSEYVDSIVRVTK